jgi:predicted porin
MADLSDFTKSLKLLDDCCADLEERVAELEATTARKGNRKVSLTVYGQVNEMVLFWDDGAMSDVYQVTNDESRTRFGFRGSAKIDSDWSAGYRIEIGVRTANSGGVKQFENAFDPGDESGSEGLDLRHAHWWIQSKTFGRVDVGQTDTPLSSTFTVTLANIPHLSGDVSSIGDEFNLRLTSGALSALDWANLMHNTQGSISRRNEVMYTTPEFAGFQLQAAWGEADFWAVSLAYAGEFSGFRLAAKASYGDVSDPEAIDSCVQTAGDAQNHDEIDCQLWSVGASVMHVPTGLFLSGGYTELEDGNVPAPFESSAAAWWVHGGIEQKYFAIGKTTLYGEYGEQENLLTNQVLQLAGLDTGTTMSFWGLGLVQSIDAAAMDMYLFYRNYSSELPPGAIEVEDLTLVGVGAIIRF